MIDECIRKIQALIKSGDLDAAEKLLLQMIEGDESIGSWPYERLAIIYRKRKDSAKEVELLLRYIDDEELSVRHGRPVGVTAWAYDRLASIYRRQGDFLMEVDIINRFIRQRKHTGRAEQYFPGRLARAEELAVSRASNGQPIQKRNRRFVAFDLEIAKILPENADDLKAFRPLGICCAAVLEGVDDHPHLWYSRCPDGAYSSQMTKDDVQELVRFLCHLVDDGATIVTWNGLGFDFDILGEESGLFDICKALAWNHVDLMFHIHCEQGHPVGLNALCQGMDIGCKPSHLVGECVPRWWAESRCDEVLSYVANDCRLILQAFHVCNTQQSYSWITRRGTRQVAGLPHGWLKVCHAINIPEPETGWMEKPFSRNKYIGWIARND